MRQKYILLILLFINILIPSLIIIGLLKQSLAMAILSIIGECICLLTSLALILKQFSKNPDNDLLEFSFKLNKNINEDFYITINYEKNIWKTSGLDNEIVFEFSNYLFPKSYIASYFIRQIHYRIINEKHLILKQLFKRQNTSNVKNLTIVFNCSSKKSTVRIIRNGKTKLNFLIKMILKGKYTRHFYHRYPDNNPLNRFVYLNERKFLAGDVSSKKS